MPPRACRPGRQRTIEQAGAATGCAWPVVDPALQQHQHHRCRADEYREAHRESRQITGVAQHQARGELVSVQRILRPRLWLQTATFVLLSAGILLVGPWALRWFGSGKIMLPLIWLLALTLTIFLDLQFSSWGTLISTANRVPYLWPSVATNIVSLTLSLILVHFPSLGLGALVLGPLLAGCTFNYWYWPLFGARSLGTTLFRLLFPGPTQVAAASSTGSAVQN